MLQHPVAIFFHIRYHFSEEVMLMKWLKCAPVFIFIADYVLSQRISQRQDSNDTVPCEDGWFYYNEKCYKTGGRTEKSRLNWKSARDFCVSFGSNLVTIENKEENDFVVGLVMLEIKYGTWIGLHDRDKGPETFFLNWEVNQPNGRTAEREDCVRIYSDFVREFVGESSDRPCDTPLGYICEKKKDLTKRSPDPRYCSSEDGGGIRFESYCYHLVTVTKTWEEAEKHCVQNYKGHLLTVLDAPMDWFLHFHLNLSLTEHWIGIKMQDRYQQKWTSGWYVGYNGFDKEHRAFLEGTCVARTKRKQWTISPCSNRYSFICEKSSKNAPVLKPPPKDSYCPKIPEGWRDLDGEYCYFIEIKSTLSWFGASGRCMRKGGHLVTILSKEENELLHTFIKYTEPYIYIGLFRLEGKANTFAWMDGSPVDFTNWDHGEPNDKNERCTAAQSSDMKWHDVPCTEKRHYICSTKKIIPKTASEEQKGPIESPGDTCEKAFIGIGVCIVLVLILLGVVIYCLRLLKAERKKNASVIGLQPLSFLVNRKKHRPAEIKTKEDETDYETMDG